MNKYINVGSITAFAGVLFGFVVLLVPDIGPDFEDRATGVVTGAASAAVGLLSLVDEIVAAYRTRATKTKARSSGGPTIFPLLAVMVLLAVAVGCETSKPFRVGAHVLGEPIAEQASHYADATATLGGELAGRITDYAAAALSPSESARRQQQAQAFADAVRDEDAIRYETVKATWADVRPWFVPALDTDPDRARWSVAFGLLDQAVVWFDRMIEIEGVRRSIFGDDDEASAELERLVNDIKSARE